MPLSYPLFVKRLCPTDRVLQISLAASIALCLAACSPMVDARGHVNTAPVADAVTPGTTSKDEVLQKFGSPSSTSTFGAETWYYITARKERVAFLAPKTVDQDVTSIEFDTAGVASKVEHYTLKDGKQINMVSRTTPTEGHSMGLMEQLLGNLGRFNKNTTRNPSKVHTPLPGGGPAGG